MESEHCQGKGASIRFTTKNTEIETCADREWRIAVGAEAAEVSQGPARRIRPVEELESLSTSKECGLIRPEILAVVLYSGPMVR